MESSKRTTKKQTTTQAETPKRSKIGSPHSISIEDLNARKAGNTFEGDIIVVYKSNLDKANQSHELLRADLTDVKAEMTITLNVTGHLIKEHEDKIIPGSAIRISNFQIAHKTDYDRGDCDCIIILQDTSTVDIIPRLCEEYKFIPEMTIQQLLTTTNNYPIGTVAALVISTKRTASQFLLEIKDGDSDMDKAQGRLKFFGTIIYPKNKYISLHFPRGSGNIVCEDSFDSLVVFSDVWWIGTKEENPEELQLDFPKELKQEKHAEFDFKGGAGLVSDHKDISGTQLPLKECAEELPHDTDSDSESLRHSLDKSTINVVREESKTPVQEESKTPVRTSSRTVGKTYKFVDSPSEDEIESKGSDSSSSDIEVTNETKKQQVNRNLFDMHEEATVGDSVPILANLENNENKKASTLDIQNASSSAQKTSTRKKSKESVNKSPILATTRGLVQSSLSSFLHKPEEKKLQSEKTPVTKVQKRQQQTDSKGKSKKKKIAEEKSSQEEEMHTTSRQDGRRISGRGESGSKAKQSKKRKESSDEEEVPSESEESDDSDEDWKG